MSTFPSMRSFGLMRSFANLCELLIVDPVLVDSHWRHILIVYS